MPPTVSVEILVEQKQVTRTLMLLDSALTPVALAGFMKGTMVQYLQSRFAAGFASESDPAGVGWAPLADATVNIRRSKGYGGEHPINVRTRDLQQYITNSPGMIVPAVDQAILRYPSDKPARGELGDKVRRAQKGDKRTPPRPVLGLTPEDQVFFLESLSTYVSAAMKL